LRYHLQFARAGADVAIRFIARGHGFRRISAFQNLSASRHNEGTAALPVQPVRDHETQPQTQETTMKPFILAALFGISSIAAIVAPAHADSSFKVHGYTTSYGR
jgi:hypothetical protein